MNVTTYIATRYNHAPRKPPGPRRLQNCIPLPMHIQFRMNTKAKQDRASRLVNQSELDDLCQECGFAAYAETSAKNRRNVRQLRRNWIGTIWPRPVSLGCFNGFVMTSKRIAKTGRPFCCWTTSRR